MGGTIRASILLAIFLGGLSACAPRVEEPPKTVTLSPVSYSALPGWLDGTQAGLIPALRLSCADWLKRGPATKASGAIGGLTAGAFHAPCRALGDLKPDDNAAMRVAIERWFAPFAVSDTPGNGKGMVGLFTGYYEPEIAGALKKSARFSVPVFARPPDLVSVNLGLFDPTLKGKTIAGRVRQGRLAPYPDRSRIDSGGLGAAATPLFWAADPVDVFFLHIQGSGRVRLPDGKLLRVGFDGHNGRPYTAIGGVLARRGAMAREKISMQSIRAWLSANPTKAQGVMNENPRYVFFRRLTGPGPIGAAGLPLTPGRSLAVDRALIPFGVPVWLATGDALDAQRSYQRLMMAQDTGGAIKGAVRGDIFFGAGADAAARAGRMNRKGRYFLLLPRGFNPGS